MNGSSSSSSNPSSVQGVCPDGWHMPSDAELIELIDYLGGGIIAGSKLKEAGTSHWSNPNTGATNGSGFTALPGCYRKDNGGSGIYGIGVWGGWWTSTEYSSTIAWYMKLYNGDDSAVIVHDFNKELGLSVRCLRN